MQGWTNKRRKNNDRLVHLHGTQGRYGKLKTQLSDNFALEANKYPCTLTVTLALLRDVEDLTGAKRNKG